MQNTKREVTLVCGKPEHNTDSYSSIAPFSYSHISSEVPKGYAKQYRPLLSFPKYNTSPNF